MLAFDAALGEGAREAHIGLALAAVEAVVGAGAAHGAGNVVAGCEPRRLPPHLLHLPDGLMADDEVVVTGGRLSGFAVVEPHVGAADPHRQRPHQDLAGAGLRLLDLHQACALRYQGRYGDGAHGISFRRLFSAAQPVRASGRPRGAPLRPAGLP